MVSLHQCISLGGALLLLMAALRVISFHTHSSAKSPQDEPGFQVRFNARKKRGRMALITVNVGDKDAVKQKTLLFSQASQHEYALTHGYDHITMTTNLMGTELSVFSAHWLKVYALVGHFVEKYDWVMWADRDFMITNYDLQLQDIINQAISGDIILVSAVCHSFQRSLPLLPATGA
jgi:hypothetical protein